MRQSVREGRCSAVGCADHEPPCGAFSRCPDRRLCSGEATSPPRGAPTLRPHWRRRLLARTATCIPTGLFVGFILICAIIASIAIHPALAADAAVWQLGSLGYRVGQLAFDTWKVVGFFFAKNLVIYFRWPARYSQLRAPLVEQVVPPPATEAAAQEQRRELGASLGGRADDALEGSPPPARTPDV